MALTTPTPVTPLPTPPSSGDPANFDARADAFLAALPGAQTQLNQLAQATYNNANEALTQARNTGNAAQLAQQAAALAAQHATAAGSASNAQSWTSGAAYQVNDVVWGQTSQGVLFRCIQAHTGSSTPPEQDAVRWVSIGARVTVSPTAGPSQTTLTRNTAGTLTRVDFTLDGKTGSTTLTRDAHGRIATVVTAYDGKTRTETLHRDTAGVLTHITATEE